MPSVFGIKFSFKAKRRPESVESSSSFSVIRRSQQTEAPSAPRLSTGWTLSPTSPIGHSKSPISPARPGSPENYQQAYFGGGDSISPTSPVGPRRLFVTNPDPDMVIEHTPTPAPSEARIRLPAPPPAREAHELPRLSSLIIPGKVSPPRQPAFPPEPAFQSHRATLGPYPDNIIPHRGTGSQDHLPFPFDPRPAPRKARYETFEDMGFMRVKRVRTFWNPFTWRSNKTSIMPIDKIDPRKYVVVPSQPALPDLRPAPLVDVPPLPAHLSNPFAATSAASAASTTLATDLANDPAAALAEARNNLLGNPLLHRQVPAPTEDPAWIGRHLERPSAPVFGQSSNRLPD